MSDTDQAKATEYGWRLETLDLGSIAIVLSVK